MPEKIVRDPVHDVIAFQMDCALERLLFELINAEEFQRLRRIHQLGLTSLAYPGADHSRYSHSLGVMETARRMLRQIALDFEVDEYQKAVCLSAALLHDLGHGPFSHVFERVSGIEHEDFTCRIILDPDTCVHRILRGFASELPQDVVKLLKHAPGRTWLSDVISSQLDADRFDYLLRDNLMTGSRYGDFDLNWLLHALTIDQAGDRLAVHAKGVSAVEAFLQSRYHMYRNVYFHKVVRSAEGLVKLVLQRAKRLAVQDRLAWPAREHPVHSALLGRQLSVREFVDLDDISMLHCFKLWSSEQDAVLAKLCHGLLYRKLFKAIELPRGMEDGASKEMFGKMRDAVTAAGGEADYELFYDEPAATPYVQDEQSEREIAVVTESGNVVSFGAISSVPDALNRQLVFRRVHVSEAYEGVVHTVTRKEYSPRGRTE